mgnify:CR=1 FL=1
MPAPPVTATPVAFARAIAEAYRRRGLSPHAALARAGIGPGTIRLSIGLEDADDLIDDLKRALKIAEKAVA